MKYRMIARLLLYSLVIMAPPASLARATDLPAVDAQTTEDKAACWLLNPTA